MECCITQRAQWCANNPLGKRACVSKISISLKKVFTIIVCLLCALTASAVGYASPYKGAGRGYIHTTSSARLHYHGNSGGGMTQAPSASMRSSSYGGMMASATGAVASVSMPAMARTSSSGASTLCSVHTISTVASAIQGGVTSNETYERIAGLRRSPGGNPEICHCVDTDGNGYCDHCGAEFDEFDGGCSNDPCWCPLEFNWAVALFMSILATAYGVYKKRTSTLQ